MSAEPQVVTPQATLLNQVAVLVRLAQAYDASNPIMGPPLAALARTLKGLDADSEIRVDLVADSFFVNKALVRVPQGLAEAADGLRKTFMRLAIQRLGFAPTTAEPELRAFLEVFQRHWRTPTPQAIKSEPAGAVRVATLGSAGDDVAMTGAAIDVRQHLLKSYARLVIIARDAVSRTQAGQPPLVPQARRAVQALIDASKDHEALLMGLTRFPGLRGDLGAFHAAVAAHCLVMARRLGLAKVTLVDVVLAALTHHLGSAHPAATGSDDPESQRLPLLSMAAVLRDGVRPDTAWHGAAAFEVGLPSWHQDLLRPGALARFIAVPAAYERFIAPRPPNPAVSPDQALRLLQDQAGVRFDTSVVTLFISLLGIYPIGTMVKLDDGATAVVIDVPAQLHLADRPVVRVVRGASGPASYLVDLSKDQVSITGTVDPSREQVNPTFFLLG